MNDTNVGWVGRIARWMEDHLTLPGLPLWASLLIISVAMAAGSIAVTIWALIRIPADYFVGAHRPRALRNRHPIIIWVEIVTRNLLGWFLILLGIVLSFPGVPGQGLLTILLGLMMADFPGKRKMEQSFVRWPRVRGPVDKLRRKFGSEPLILEDDLSADFADDADKTKN